MAPFCVAELSAGAETAGAPIKLIQHPPWLCVDSTRSLFCVFEASSTDVVRQIAMHCVLLRAVYQLIAAAASVDELLACLGEEENDASVEWETHKDGVDGSRRLRGTRYKEELLRLRKKSSTRVELETVGRHYPVTEKAVIVERAAAAMGVSPSTNGPTLGERPCPVQNDRVHIVLEHSLDSASGEATGGPVLRALCGKFVASSERQHVLARYALRQRPYVGTTSMPPEPAFVMVHLACVRRASFVFDPFAGTGGILVAAAHCGAVTLASDVDGRALQRGTRRGLASVQQRQQRQVAMRAYGADDLERANISNAEVEMPSMLTNFKIYGLRPPDRVRMNFASWDRALRTDSKKGTKGAVDNHPQRCEGFLDAIVTDPPYGIREPRKGVKESRDESPIVQQLERQVKYDSGKASGDQVGCCEGETIGQGRYTVADIVLDLLLFAAEALVIGGRLVLWYPSSSTQYNSEEIPSHPSLDLIHNIPQKVSLKIARHLLVFVKARPMPSPPPTRAMCASVRQAQDLRLLIGTTDLPENAEYMRYRQKLMRKREAAKRFHSLAVQCSTGTIDLVEPNKNIDGKGDDSGCTEVTCPIAETKTKNAMRKERSELIVKNRETKFQVEQQHRISK
ncbi:putative RNA methylase family UPF0020 [Trypanosoma vivax]|nr:putative methyltransferase [Trypanosoma vivax]KAH8617019.1 putative RNA methylase family UPF0020 [Trypanosoma vivax]